MAWQWTIKKAQDFPDSYAHTVRRWLLPLCELIVRQQTRSAQPIVVGLTGCQGSGKSTMAAALEYLLWDKHQLSAVTLSLDDFYLTREERRQLAAEVHPLFATRGVPGTHDMPLLFSVLDKLASKEGSVSIPRFDKAQDDRVARECWFETPEPVQVVLLEGWCLGVQAQPEPQLLHPVNTLEAEQDVQGVWRRYVNQQIHKHYEKLYSRVDLRILLKAPSFECVYAWRLQQEQALAASPAAVSVGGHIMTAEEVRHFIQFYERLTRDMLARLPDQAHVLLSLDSQREITDVLYPVQLN